VSAIAPTSPLRFIAYARTSTDDTQSPADSRRWQVDTIERLIAGHGTIVEVVHDVGFSRALPWQLRPEAVALIERCARPAAVRGFDAIAVAGPQRAFGDASQATDVLRKLAHYGIELWVPEVGGRVDLDNEGHGILLGVFGTMSESERRRIGQRVANAGRAHVKSGERFWVGGRAPYGYRLVPTDALHPNPVKARDGVRLKRLKVEPTEAEIVREIFERYAAGHGVRQVCAWLDTEGVPTPLRARPNVDDRPRVGQWAKSTVEGILRNPAYTGHLVWARERGRQRLRDVHDTSLGYRKTYVATPEEHWVWSPEPVHEPIVDRALWDRVQSRRRSDAVDWSGRAARGPQATSPYPFALRGIVTCAMCGHPMEGAYQRGSAYVRCRLSPLAAQQPECADHPKVAYLREDRVLPALVPLLERLLTDPVYAEATVQAMATASATSPATGARVAGARRRIDDGRRRLDELQAIVGTGVDPEVMGAWIREAAGGVRAAEAELATLGQADQPVDVEAVRALVAKVGPTLAKRLARLPNDKLHAFLFDYGVRIEWRPGSDEATLTWDLGNSLVGASSRAPGSRRDGGARTPSLRR
jgi:site-specific DNA recombinase